MAVCKIDDYEVSPSDEFFFDTNVWMFLFAPLAGSKPYKQKMYSRLLKEIQSRGAWIWINSLVVAEYINAVLRLDFKQWMSRNGYKNADYKHDFRPTSDYQDSLYEVKAQVKNILRLCQRKSDNFHSISIGEIIDNMGTSCDFGDSMIADLCKSNKSIRLVTDDSDIVNSHQPFNVLTA